MGDPAARRRRRRVVLIAAGVVVALVGAGLLAAARTFDTYWTPSSAMEPTLSPGDRMVVRGIDGDEVSRGDVVILTVPNPDGQGQMDVIKRVIAVAGDEIATTAGGKVTIDGEPADEPYLDPDTITSNLEEQVVPDDHLFVMGDNRRNSLDSRATGPVPHDDVIALAVSRWPPGSGGF